MDRERVYSTVRGGGTCEQQGYPMLRAMCADNAQASCQPRIGDVRADNSLSNVHNNLLRRFDVLNENKKTKTHISILTLTTVHRQPVTNHYMTHQHRSKMLKSTAKRHPTINVQESSTISLLSAMHLC